MASDFTTLRRKLRKQGFIVEEQRRGGHYRVTRPDGGVGQGTRKFVVVASTPSDRRSLQNTLRDLKKLGFRWP